LNFYLSGITHSAPHVVAPHDVVLVSAGHGRKGRSNFVTNPTTRALEVAPDAGLIIEKALLRTPCGMKFRIYLRLALLYVAKLRLQCASAALQSASDVLRFFR
jgi:hypothetical protein